MAETVRKIIVDSRYFVSGDAGSGIYELPEVVEIHGTQVLYLEQFSSINSWLWVDKSNNQFYLIEWPYGVKNTKYFNTYRPESSRYPIRHTISTPLRTYSRICSMPPTSRSHRHT